MRRALLLAVTILLVIGGIILRWQHLGAAFSHFDETFPVALIARARATGNLDMNPRDADVPPIARYNQYAGSSYHYAVLAWDTVMRVVPHWPQDNRIKPSLVRLRAFSALCATAALLLLAWVAWRLTGPPGAVVATALIAFNPTLVQDAHYARPDAMLTLLVIAFAVLIGHRRPPSLRRVFAAGIVLGVLVAAKNTTGLLAGLPLIWFGAGRPARDVMRSLVLLTGVALVTFLATEPGVLLHFSAFRDGVQRLQTQYSHPFPIHGPPDGGNTYGMAGAYFLATLGLPTLALAVAGVLIAWRNGKRRATVLWVAPLLVYAAYFGSKTIFFERAYGTFLPGLFLATGIAAAALADRTRSMLIPALVTLACAAPGARVSGALATDVLSGAADARVAAYDAQMHVASPGVDLVPTPLWHHAHAEALAERWASGRHAFMVRISDYGDAWTRAAYTQLFQRLPARELQVLTGPFAGFPVSTLQVYHVPTWRYVWVGDTPAPTLPSPPEPPSGARWLHAIAAKPAVYWTIAWVFGSIPLSLAAMALQSRSATPRPRLSDEGHPPRGKFWKRLYAPTLRPGSWVFPVSLALALFAFRWPGFFHYPEFNVDEAQTIAGAITLQSNPLYWQSVDGSTHGPLNDFVLLLPRLFGAPVNFVTARVVGLGLVAAALIALWAGFRAIWGETSARLAVLPPLAFFALNTFWDFVHYTSEHLTVFLLALGGALLLVARGAAGARAGALPEGNPVSGFSEPGSKTAEGEAMPHWRWPWLLAGLSLGAVPWAKMQGVPVALVLVAVGFGLVATIARRESTWRLALVFAAGLVLPSLLVAVYLTMTGLWPDFWAAYVVNNLRYATQTKMFSVVQMVTSMPAWTRDAEGYAPYVFGIAGFLLVAAFARLRGWAMWLPVACAATLVLVSVYAAVAPGRKFFHYILFTILPLATITPALLAALLRDCDGVRRWCVASLFIGCTLVPQIVVKVGRPHPDLSAAAVESRPRSAIATEILRHARAGEPLGIWGYMPRYWVETGLPQAARDGHNERQVLPHPQQTYYRARYLADLQRTRPSVMVDAVGPGAFWLSDRSQYGHETWPELNAWIDASYGLAAEVDGARIYVARLREPFRK